MKLCDCFFSLINIDNIKLYLQFLTSYIMIYFEFNQVQFIKKIELYGIVWNHKNTVCNYFNTLLLCDML